MNVNEMVDQLSGWYDGAAHGTCAKPEQWARIVKRDPDSPFALVNFFKLRETARYDSDWNEDVSVSGQEAFARYASVSVPTMERVGGAFLLVAPFQASFVGQDEDWDLVAVGRYPNLQAFLDLHRDEGYRAAYRHRTAGCERQKVLICDG